MRRKLVVSLLIIACVLGWGGQTAGATPTQPPVPILMYHHLAPAGTFSESANRVIVTPENFAAQLAGLKAAGYETISLSDLYLARSQGKTLPAKPIVITFDDGYESNYLYAFPILQQLEMKATINLIVAWVGKDLGFHRYLSWEQAKKMIASGLVEIGSHTYDLHSNGTVRLDGESDTAFTARLTKDLRRAKAEIEQNLGIENTVFAYPYGKNNVIARQVLKNLGYRVGVTVTEGIADADAQLLQLPRICVLNTDTAADLIKRIADLQAANAQPAVLRDLQGHWAAEVIEQMARQRIVQGDGKGKFCPDRTITRDEFLTLLNRLDGYNHADVFQTIFRGAKLNVPITREEAARLLAYYVPADYKQQLSTQFTDLGTAAYPAEIIKVVGYGLMTGYNDHTFRPQGKLTRAEAVVVLSRLD